MAITGTYTGAAPASVEACWAGGAWAVIDAAPAGGTFSGVLAAQAAGQGTLEVRDSGNVGVTDTAAYVGVGDVFVVAGQSNASGRATNNQVYSHATLKAVMLRYGDTVGQWKELADPTDTETLLGSPYPLLATAIMADQGVPVGFITTAKGNTGLAVEAQAWTTWNRDFASHADYDHCVDTIRASNVNGIAAVLWYQGENDAVPTGTASQAEYATALGNLIDYLQADVGLTFPLMAAQPGHQDNVGQLRAAIDGIRLAIQQLWDTDPDILPGPLTYDVNLLDGGGDGIHFTTDAEIGILAARWWHFLKLALYGGTAGRAPRYTTGRLLDATHIEIEFSLANPPLLAGGAPITGWRVVDGSGALTVTDCSIASPLVTLTVDRDLSGLVHVSFASGNDAVDATLIDSSTAGLPPEPSIDIEVGTWTVASTGWWR